jgi:small subunit ribosomal protein S6
MREYETTLIIQPEISDEGVGELRERLDGVLGGYGSIRLLYDDLGKRRLAYEIKNFQKGRYVLLQFLDDGSHIKAFERALRLEDSIIRFLTVQVHETVEDVAARKAEAAEAERTRAEKAAERAAREAEDAARQDAEAATARSSKSDELDASDSAESESDSEFDPEFDSESEDDEPSSAVAAKTRKPKKRAAEEVST